LHETVTPTKSSETSGGIPWQYGALIILMLDMELSLFVRFRLSGIVYKYMQNATPLKIAFFGSPEIAVIVLEELKQAGYLPALVVTNPDRPQGRGMVLTPTPVKAWAQTHTIKTIELTSLKNSGDVPEITSEHWDLFIVVAYGLIMPRWLLDLPKHGTLNVHPSLLPKLRGASPIRTSILEGMKDTGVTIMLMDEKMDHGPILVQQPTKLTYPIPGRILDENLAHQGGLLLCDIIPKWIAGEITPTQQNHEEATFCGKITKDMGELQIDPHNLPTGDAAYQIVLKVAAFDGWPGTFFFHEGKRVKIVDAGMSADQLAISRVIPEGKKEIDFTKWIKNLPTP
jgi:methionyl-tRNA formyltransferase